jgi:hypothetical protein
MQTFVLYDVWCVVISNYMTVLPCCSNVCLYDASHLTLNIMFLQERCD